MISRYLFLFHFIKLDLLKQISFLIEETLFLFV